MIFFSFSLFLFLCAIIENKILFRVSALMLGAYFSFTFAYGYDWLNYYQSYQAVRIGGTPFFGDLGFIFLMKACIYFGLSYGGFSFVVNAILYFLIYNFCNKLRTPSFALFALFSFLGFFMFTEQIRQGFALSIVLYGLTKFFDKSKIKFFITVCIASLFHVSAVLSFFYFATIINNRRRLLISIISSFILYSIFLILMLNPTFIAVFQGVESKFQAYGSMYSDLDTNFFSFLLHAKMLFVYLFFGILLYIFGLSTEQKYSVYSNLFMLILTRSSSLLVRVSYYFLPVLIYSLDEYISSLGRGLSTNWKKLSLLIVILFVSTLPLWTPMYRLGAQTNLDLFSNPNEFNKEIGRKCMVLHINSDITTDGCR